MWQLLKYDALASFSSDVKQPIRSMRYGPVQLTLKVLAGDELLAGEPKAHKK
jgi:hypothetical protein